MAYPRWGLLLALALSLAPFSFSQKTDLYIYVDFSDNLPAKYAYKVDLLTSTRMHVDTELTNDRGQAIFRRVDSRDYRVVVTGPDIDETEISVTVESRPAGLMDFQQNEHVTVRRTKKDVTGVGGAVSAATLSIPDNARKEFDKGQAALNQKDFAAARQHFLKAVDLFPQYCGALVDLGILAMQDRQAEEGKKFFQKAVEADPENPIALVYFASAQMLDRNYKNAESLLLKATAIVPTDPQPLTMLASSQLAQGELEQAVVNAKKVHSLKHEQFAFAHYVAAQALIKESQPQQAAEELKLFLQEAPNAPQAGAAKATLNAIQPPK